MKRRPHSLEWWIAVLRLGAVPFAVLQIALTANVPSHDETIAWLLTAALAVGGLALFALVGDGGSRTFSLIAMAFDFVLLGGFVLVFAFEVGTPTRQLLLIGVVGGAIRFGMVGGILTALAYIPVDAWFEERRSHLFHEGFRTNYVTFQAGSGLIMALLVGWLVNRIDTERDEAARRAEEAEQLRDELGRRADLLEAANRCARALNTSLDLDEAFGAFIRELRGLIAFERMAIVLSEDGVAHVIATAGAEPPDASLEDDLLSEVVSRGQTIVREGRRSRIAAPLLAGARSIGMISIARAQAGSFTPEEIELTSLLGRLAASTVQNIRAFDSERRTVEELRRLSALRADFVSLVSHELRSPMAAVIGASRTLQSRWRELTSDQREAFLGLIGDETARLAALIGDVLDTSRIDAGTFSYRFQDVDIVALVSESVAAAGLAQDEIPVTAELSPLSHAVRGDGERLRQVIQNLIENAVKYSPAGASVDVVLASRNGGVSISVTDQGPGIARDDQALIFEKFGRVATGNSKPGTGLGLYIARSIAEAHGGQITVSSAPGRGATFTLTL